MLTITSKCPATRPRALQINLVLALRHYKRKQDIITVIIKIASYYPLNNTTLL